jgi:hypothetical protein
MHGQAVIWCWGLVLVQSHKQVMQSAGLRVGKQAFVAATMMEYLYNEMLRLQ